MIDNNTMDRDLLESYILSCITKDITLITEVNEDYFQNDKCYFYYKLIKEMSRNAKELDELSVVSWVNTNNLKDLFEAYGGYDSIKNLLSLDIRVSNFDSYLDSLKKIMVLHSYDHLGINFDKEFEIEGQYVNPIASMPLLNGEEFSDLLMNIVTGKALKVQTEDYKLEQMYFSDEEMYKKMNNIRDKGDSFDITLRYNDPETNKEMYIQSFKLLNSTLNAFQPGTGNVQLSAHSGLRQIYNYIKYVYGISRKWEKMFNSI